jgi:hypothetical protein
MNTSLIHLIVIVCVLILAVITITVASFMLDKIDVSSLCPPFDLLVLMAGCSVAGVALFHRRRSH